MATWIRPAHARFAAAGLAMLVAAGAALPAGDVAAQGNSRTFPETGKTVKGRFLEYWNQNGGLSQQGFPISEEMQERSDTDGKTYMVQYFERAVFEMHPENARPYDVLLSLLGNSYYRQKYPNGAPNQKASTSNPRRFTETGRTIGGRFRQYWEQNGGLAQQGFPISDEFQERSPLDGKTYTVQYFERAVFEMHPENRAPFDVLLSQLGKFQYDAKYAKGNQNTGHVDKNARVIPRCGTVGTKFRYEANGFTPGEALSFWFTAEADGSVFGTARPTFSAPDNGAFFFEIPTDFNVAPGWYAMTWQGDYSKHQSIGWFQVVANGSQCGSGTTNPTPVPQPTQPPTQGCDVSGSRNGRAEPASVRPGSTVRVYAQGFTPNEPLSLWLTAPDGSVGGTQKPEFQVPSEGGFYLDIPTSFDWAPGRWAITFQGDYSRHQAVVFFCVTP